MVYFFFNIQITSKRIKKLKNSPTRTILDNWVFEKFTLADEPFAKALLIFETCVLVNNNLWGELATSWKLPTTFDERFKVTSVHLLFLIPKILISNQTILHWKYYIESFYFNIILKQNKFMKNLKWFLLLLQ